MARRGAESTTPRHCRRRWEELVDFDLINASETRLAVGAVNVRTGNSIYFDNYRSRDPCSGRST